MVSDTLTKSGSRGPSRLSKVNREMLAKIEKDLRNRSLREGKMEWWSINHLCDYSIILIQSARRGKV